MFEVCMKYTSEDHLFEDSQLSYFSHFVIKWHLGHMVSFVLLPHLKLIWIALTWLLCCWLNNLYLVINMFPKNRFRIYVFTLVGALVGIWQCMWMRPVIRTWTTSLFLSHSWVHVIWYQKKSGPFKALLHNFISKSFLFFWSKGIACWPKIIFFIIPIDHTGVETGT